LIEETATVLRTEEDVAWVETMRKSACDTCAVNKGCGTSVLSQVLGKRHTQVRALNPVGALAGETVVVGIQEQSLVRGSMAMYAVPLLGLLAGAVAGGVLDQMLQTKGEGLSLLMGLLGLMAGFWWLRRFARKISHDARYQPVVLRRQA
jgi:sigma-E factor negative regulatory protein RseC